MKTFLLFFALLLTFDVTATHIVGGEIDMQAITNTGNATHQITLNLYFDDINGSSGAEDPFVTVGIFRKRDNYMMGIVSMPKVSTQQVTYSNPLCAGGARIQTRLIKYSGTAILMPINFDDAAGYYIAWERCCRNTSITNIQDPGSAGSTFYLEFPAFKQDNGTIINNSTPKFDLPTGDYSCINRPFSMSFAAEDADGDSLTYSLVTPLNGYTTRTYSNPTYPTGSSNYPLVQWVSGINLNNVIPGSSPLKVNPKTGLLTLTASTIGLYVFCVQVDEYRKGKKIGTVRRDFQLKVIDCTANDAPVSAIREQGKTSNYIEGNIIRIKSGQSPKCINLFTSDKNIGQNVSTKIKPVNFPDSTLNASPNSYTVKTAADTLKTSICFNDCNVSWDGEPLIFDVITTDDGCPQGLSSTIRVSVIIEPNPSSLPKIRTDLGATSASIFVGNTLKFNVIGTDSLKNLIKVTAIGRGFNLAQAGMTFIETSGNALVSVPFTWSPTCSMFRKEEYLVDFIVSKQYCNKTLTDTVTVRLKILILDNKRPKISTTLAQNTFEYLVSVANPSSISFDVIGEDTDVNDVLKLTAIPNGFNMKNVGMNWTDQTAKGTVRGSFQWTPTCLLLDNKESMSFPILFKVEDNSCSNNKTDSVTIKITLKNKIADYTINAPNVFTPNEDGKNDYFAITDLPEDNCTEQFESLKIVNRWGEVVYETKDRNFKWYGNDLASGEYYYLVSYTKHSFKGWLTLLR